MQIYEKGTNVKITELRKKIMVNFIKNFNKENKKITDS